VARSNRGFSCSDRFFVGNVDCVSIRGAAEPFELVRQRPGAGVVAVANLDGCALGGERAAYARSDPRGAADHDREAALQLHDVSSPPFLLRYINSIRLSANGEP